MTQPHVIPVHEAGEIDGRLYLTMPIIDGTDLHTVLQRDGPLTPQRAVDVIEQLAAALDAAHAVGLVHRDVKPSNALLTGDDFVYLIDFGIAHDTAATKLTQTGSERGHPGLHVPRALEYRDRRCPLGCLRAGLRALRMPHRRPTLPRGQLGTTTRRTPDPGPPKPSHPTPPYPQGFDEVIATGMAKDPDQRYHERQGADRRRAPRPLSSTSAPGADTQTVATTEPALATTTDPVRRHPPPRAVEPQMVDRAAVVVLIAAVGAGVVLRNVLSSTPTTELVLTAATDPGANPFMPPAATPPPTNTQPPPTLQPHGNGPVVTQSLPGDRDGLYGGTMNNAECDRDKMIDFLSSHPAQAGAFVEALNTDPALFLERRAPPHRRRHPHLPARTDPHRATADTPVTNHGFDGTHPTTLQSVFQPGTAVFVDAHGLPRARCYCGNPLTAPTALTGEPKPVGAPWAGYNPDALAAAQPSKAAITTFVLIDVVTGQPFNRPADTAPPPSPFAGLTAGTRPAWAIVRSRLRRDHWAVTRRRPRRTR